MKADLQIRPISIVLATVFLSAFGVLWYGLLFSDIQEDGHRFTSEEYASFNPLWYIGGIVISFFIAWGLGMIIKLQGKAGIKAGVIGGLKAVVGFGVPLVSYPLVFSPLHDFALYAVGASQIIIAWAIAGGIIGGMIKKNNRIHKSTE